MTTEEHYFSADPKAPFQRARVRAHVWGRTLELTSGTGVFAHGRIDIGTAVLFRETDPPASGATFLDGPQWGDYDGLLLIGLLKEEGVLALRLDADGALVEQFRLPELDGTHGRLRSVQQGTDGALYVTTDNGEGADRLLRVTPR